MWEFLDKAGEAAMRRTRIAAVAATAALVLAGCVGTGAGPTGKRVAGDADIPELTWAMPGAPRSLDIAHALDTRSNLAIFAAFDGLLRMDADGELQPALATSWTNPDPLTYVYKLRQGVTFWDGKPMTAEDVAHSLRRQADPAEAAETQLYLTRLKEVAATGPDEVTVRLTTPDPMFKYVPALVWIVQQKEYAEAAGKSLGSPEKPGMGTGPYRVTRFSPADGVDFERHDGYWDTRPKVAKLAYKPIPDPEALRLAMMSGEVDGTFGVPLQDIRKWERTAGISMYYTRTISVNYLSMDVTTAPFDDVHVRRAIAHSVDRQGLLDPLFGGRARLSSSPVSSLQLETMVGKEKAAEVIGSLPTYPFDLGKAKEELAKSRYAGGFTVEVPYPTTQPWSRLLLENLARNLSTIGVTLVPKAQPDQQWVANIYAHKDLKLQIMRAGGGTPYPGEMLPMMFGQASAGPNGFNTANFADPELEAKLGSLGEDVAPIAEIMRLNAEEVPYVPLFEEDAAHALRAERVFSPDPTPWLAGFNWAIALKAAA
ncbi:peptide/nickel transport system substrate-binding protein [Saccharothrix tamanrassetensis]|uniref:Peptide/nickel transport system substrate-binding protein n=1 Tax=Saccharothrix tamanrassetensis TaxID=1051531 RepID=A0A841CP01_9PSEU|nr:ABC transporter substrate-binding protein [Saccharothrix tamanrassetensis]MBB5958643.1 peptide/nickel transport system substrate-binding protein [Saccharothrix tamanrassetensis]